jgi:hypothetical protein
MRLLYPTVAASSHRACFVAQADIDEAVQQTRQRAEQKIRGLEDQIQDARGRIAQVKGARPIFCCAQTTVG